MSPARAGKTAKKTAKRTGSKAAKAPAKATKPTKATPRRTAKANPASRTPAPKGRERTPVPVPSKIVFPKAGPRSVIRLVDAVEPKIKVLVVEDNPDDVLLIEMLLENGSVGYDVTRVSSLKAALSAARHGNHVTLLDLDLDDSRGIATAERWVAAQPEDPVVVLTGRRDKHLAFHALQLGVHEFISKNDATTEALEGAIQRAIERARVVRFRRGLEEGSLRLRRRPTRGVRHMGELVEPEKPLVYVSLHEGAAHVRAKLQQLGAHPARLAVVAVPAAGGRPVDRNLAHIEVASASRLEDLVLAIETGCARMGRDCRVVIDDLESLAASNAPDRCAEFLESLKRRLALVGIHGEVLVGGQAQSDVIAAQHGRGLANA